MKTFLVFGVGYHEDEKDEVLYVGQDEEKAFNIDIGVYSYLRIQVWVDGLHFQTLLKKDIYDWILKYDKIESVENKFKEHEREMAKYKSELDLLKSVFYKES